MTAQPHNNNADTASSLTATYPWTTSPLISCAPMRLIANAKLAAVVSIAGGLGFIGAGSDISTLSSELSQARDILKKANISTSNGVLPIGVGFLIWGAPLEETLAILSKPENIPAAVWLFAPRSPNELKDWTDGVRKATGNKTKIWIQVTSVREAFEAVTLASPDVLVVQGTDAGGHGAAQGAGIISLVPETIDAVTELCKSSPSTPLPFFVAAGGISEGRGAAAALCLGAQGICLGTRYLAAEEATIASGYRDAVLRASDGGSTTIRSSVYDQLRGTTEWPAGYGGRGVLNASYRDHEAGVTFEDNKKLYEEAVASGDKGWEGDRARLTTYAGTGIGLVKTIMSAEAITQEVRDDAAKVLSSVSVSKL
jgi:nitronate monooxygenase